MSLDPEFLASWKYLEPRDVFAVLNAEPRPKHGVVWTIENEIKPIDLVCYLAARFGPPNGIQNYLREDDSDNLIHWEWAFDSKLGRVNVMGMNFRTEVQIGSSSPITADDRDDFIAQVKSDFAAHGRGMSLVRKSFEHWIEFVNPYVRLRHSVDRLVEQLKALKLDPLADSAVNTWQLTDEQAKENWEATMNRYSLGLGICFGIRSMLPVMAEAFVNFIMYVLLRPEIREDNRLRENAFRQPIDVRVKSLSLNCLGFAKPIDYADPACGRYHSLVNERNDLLHGNVVIDKLKFNEVFFKGKIPIFKEYRSMWQRSVGVEIHAVGLDHVLDELTTVQNFIEYVLSCTLDDLRPHIERLLTTRDLGLNESNGRIGVLFPSWLVDFRAVVRSPDHATEKNSKTGNGTRAKRRKGGRGNKPRS